MLSLEEALGADSLKVRSAGGGNRRRLSRIVDLPRQHLRPLTREKMRSLSRRLALYLFARNIPFEQQGFTGRLGERVGKAVAEVQPGRVPALAEAEAFRNLIYAGSGWARPQSSDLGFKRHGFGATPFAG